MSNTVSSFFSGLAALAASNVLPPLFAVVNTTLTDIETNPQEWVNPVSGLIKGQAALANILASVPAMENAAVPAAAQVVGGIFTAIQNKLASLENGQTAEQIGEGLVNGVSNQANVLVSPSPQAQPVAAAQQILQGHLTGLINKA